MARKKTSHEDEDAEPGLDISSLIDVCFLLLIYFLVTTTIQPREQDLSLQLPAAGAAGQAPTLAPMFVKIDRSGVIFINTGPAQERLDDNVDQRKLPQLQERLISYSSVARAGGSEPVVQVWADPEALQQRVVDVLNCLAGAEVKSVTFTDLIDQI